MERSLTRGEILVGRAGLGLLRLHRSGDTGAARAIRDELARALRRIDEPPYDQDVLGEALDVTAGYSRWAAVYDQPGNVVLEYEQPAVWDLLDSLPGQPVLDAACGTGRHLRHLQAAGREVIGIDSTPAMLDRARAKAPEAELRVGDLLSLPLADGSVAGAVCALALEHVAELGRAYAELARVVTQGGWVVVSTMHPVIRNIVGWGAWFIDEDGKAELPTYCRQLSDHLNAATAAGLRLVRCLEPVIEATVAQRMAVPEIAVAEAAALRDIPIVLICQFEKLANHQRPNGI